MKRALVTATFAAALFLVPWEAVAGTSLVSAPLKGGEGGAICACLNSTDKAITVDFVLRNSLGYIDCQDLAIAPGYPSFCAVAWTATVVCVVARDDGKTPSTKQLGCTLSALDINGNPTAVVPVDKKLKD